VSPSLVPPFISTERLPVDVPPQHVDVPSLEVAGALDTPVGRDGTELGLHRAAAVQLPQHVWPSPAAPEEQVGSFHRALIAPAGTGAATRAPLDSDVREIRGIQVCGGDASGSVRAVRHWPFPGRWLPRC